MSSTKKGIIGAIIGAVVLTIIMWIAMSSSSSGVSAFVLAFIPAGALYGFGYAFGWGYIKPALAKALGVAGGASFLTILFSKENTWLKVIFIYIIAFSLGVGFAWLPGIVKGIKSIAMERRNA